MSRPQRGLSPDEKDVWERVAKTVRPLHPLRPATRPAAAAADAAAPPPPPPPKKIKGRVPPPPPPPEPRRAEPLRPLDRHGLDGTWDRRLGQGAVAPDFTLDLHGHSLDAAHARLDHGLTQALAQGARMVLLITGRARPHEDHSTRGERRGAIRAKFMDWLAAGPHAHRIAAVRGAHPRHGGAGAVYIVLKRGR